MMDKMMLYSMMLGGGGASGSSNNSLLPLLLMQERSGEGGSGESFESNENELLEIMLYRPVGLQIVDNFASKIQNMSAAQRNRLMACQLLDMLGKNQTGKLWETMLIAAHSEVSNLVGDPLSSVTGALSTKKVVNNGTSPSVDVGAQTLGSASLSAKDKAKALDVGDGSGSVAKKGNNDSKTKRTIIVT